MSYLPGTAQSLALAGLVLTLTPLGAGPASATPAEDAAHPVTVDDVLSIGGIGEARFSQDGAWLAWNLVPPYDALEDYSWWLRAYGLSGHQLWVRNMDTGVQALQPGLDPAATNYLFGLSPDSDHVVVLEHWRGRLRLVACRLSEDACVRFDPLPDIRDRYVAGGRYNERLVWVSPESFVMPVRDPMRPGSELRNRATAGRFLWQNWNRAWSGTGPTASQVVSTGGQRAHDWADGALVEFNIVTGKTRHLAEGRYAGVRASPDGRYLLAARTGKRIRPPADVRPVARETHPVFDRRYALSLIDRQTGEVRQVATPFNVDPHSLVWDEAGARFAVYGWGPETAPENGRFYVFQRASLQGDVLPHAGLSPAGNRADASYLWWGGPARTVLLDAGLAILAQARGEERPDWFLLAPGKQPLRLTGAFDQVPRDPLHSDGVSMTLLADGAVWRIVPGQPPVRRSPPALGALLPSGGRVSPAHGWSNQFRLGSSMVRYPLSPDLVLLAGAEENGETAIVFLDARPGSAPPETLDTGQEGAHVIDASRAAGSLVATVTAGGATRLLLVRQGQADIELARINAHLDRVRHPEHRQVTYMLNDPENRLAPRQTEGCVMLPPDYDAGKSYPLLVDVYPTGTGGTCRTLKDLPQPAAVTADLWAARGFIYIRPAFPLDLIRTADGPVAAMGNVFDQTVDALVAQGYGDPDRVVLYGFSQGGLLSLVTATQTRKPAAVISMNGWADFFSHYFGARGLMRYFHLDQNGGDNRWRYECEMEGPSHYCPFGLRDSALDDPAAYARTSPVANARNITAPVLLVHSDFDYFDMAQYDEMFGALYRAGKEAVYVRYWGEGHGPSSPANIRDLWQRFDAFLTGAGLMEN